MTRKPDFRIRAISKQKRFSTVGAAWLNEDGTISIQLDVGTTLAWNDGLKITAFPTEDLDVGAITDLDEANQELKRLRAIIADAYAATTRTDSSVPLADAINDMRKDLSDQFYQPRKDGPEYATGEEPKAGDEVRSINTGESFLVTEHEFYMPMVSANGGPYTYTLRLKDMALVNRKKTGT